MAGLDADVEEVELVMTSARFSEEDVGVERAAKGEAEVRNQETLRSVVARRELTPTEHR